MIPTFPLFQLSRFASLVSDLGLTSASYLDTYNPQSGKWDQHTIASVRIVQTNQRLLYRVRKSLLEGLVESECISLSEEVDNQPKPDGVNQTASRKRSSSGAHESMPAAKQFIPESHYNPPAHDMSASPSAGPSSAPEPHQEHDMSSDLSMSPRVPPPGPPSGYLYPPPPPPFYTTPGPTTITLPWYLINPPAEPAPIPYHPHPPLKRWPNDYTVAQLSVGFYALEALCSHTHIAAVSVTGETTTATTPNLTQKAAFERVFGSRYVKSTVCRHRGVWRRAPREIREEFERYGDDERGMWGEFVRRVEGKPPGKSALANQQQLSQMPQLPGPYGQIVQHSMQGPPVGLQTVQQMVPGHETLVFHTMGPNISMAMLPPSPQQQHAPGKKGKDEMEQGGMQSLQGTYEHIMLCHFWMTISPGDSPSNGHPSHEHDLQNGKTRQSLERDFLTHYTSRNRRVRSFISSSCKNVTDFRDTRTTLSFFCLCIGIVMYM